MSNTTFAAEVAEAGQEHHHAHHFDSADQEFQASKQGMWIFLVTEVMMFGGLFVAYAMFRGMYPEMFHEAHKQLNVTLGMTNTLVLITSSLTMAVAVSATQRGQRDRALVCLVLTFILAGCFLVIKYFEWAHKFHEGLLPGGHFTNAALLAAQPKAPIFFSLYFMMTGLHGIHVIVGMCVITWMFIRTLKNEFGPNWYTPIELTGFYWHFVDIIWIYLFPLLYLIS